MSQPSGTGPEDGLPVDEVIAALEEYQRLTIAIFERNPDDPEACINGLISLHLKWTEEDPDRAKMVSRHRNAVMAGPGRERLSAANAEYFQATRAWLKSDAVADQLPGLSFNVMHALVFAPSQELAKHWLGGRLREAPTAYADRMGRAAWAGLLAAAGPPSQNYPEVSR
ncbi:MAG: hypothetical protein M3Y45_00100 [Actinomycetota bacterium]|nr:hypothetical protein [Actinomycetota bacterium]